MKKIILLLAVAGIVGLSSCGKKCYTCSGANINELNRNYCSNIYADDNLENAQTKCEERNGTWSLME